jgi:hypothetical protein
VDGEKKSIHNKIICWLFCKKIKGFNYIDLSECAKNMNLDINNEKEIKIIDNSLKLFNEKIVGNIMNYYEENN